MGRSVASVVAGLVAWTLLATLANVVLRVVLPGYSEAEPGMNFTLTMLVGRLVVGAVSTLLAGCVVSWVARRTGWSAVVFGVLLVAIFIPIHLKLWDRFPLWYHLTFLVSLLPLALLGAMMVAPRDGVAPSRPR